MYKKDKEIRVAVLENSQAAQEIIKKISDEYNNIPIKVYLTSQVSMHAALKLYRALPKIIAKVDEVKVLETDLEKMSQVLTDLKMLQEKIKNVSTTQIFSLILAAAIKVESSDIHIESEEKGIQIRFRIDGMLHDVARLEKSAWQHLISRIKLSSKLKINIKDKPQDGHFSVRIKDEPIDFRVSTFPTFFGEKVVIRILDQEKGIKRLEEVGLEGRNLETIREGLKKPYGLILLTGPTGSGKTTTLYSMLQELDREKNNVISLEDPVEYTIEGISQSQVMPEIGYNFANGLHSILRQDPDMIMVGEIRDKETASLAIQAALTGHLVLSTLHTNNAIGVIPRLVDMGVDPFLIAPTLVLAIGQRLVRTLCPDSRKSIPVTGAIKERIEKEISEMSPAMKKSVKIPADIYQGIPSSACPQGAK